MLLVDDAAEVRMIVRFVLEDDGFVVDEAADGATALVAARALPDGAVPDVVLLDVQLPDLDGPDVLQALRADPLTSALPVVFLTAGDGRLDEELVALGATGVLRKPVAPATFAGELAALL